MTRLIRQFAEVSARYRAAFVDLWGCLHDGYRPFPGAVAALRRYREGGGVVLLLTNSPRPKAAVIRQLDRIGVPRDCWDEIASSGDASQFALFSGAVGRKVYHLGPARDGSFFTDLPDDLTDPVEITRVPLDQAEGIVCTGLFDDDTETPDDYRATLLYAKNRGLKMLCTNPDLFVDKGDRRIWCAGALARAYQQMGGEALFFGKPYPPIYDLARRRLDALADVEDAEIIAIGDGIDTDIRGAMAEDLDTLFLTGGLAAEATGTGAEEEADPDPARLESFLESAQLSPTYAMGHLR